MGSSGPPKPPQSEGGNDPLTRPCHHQRVAVGGTSQVDRAKPLGCNAVRPEGLSVPAQRNAHARRA